MKLAAPTVFAATLFAAALAAPTLRAQKAPPSPEQVRAHKLALLTRDAKDWSDKTRIAAWEGLLQYGDDGVKILTPIVAEKLRRDRAALEEWWKGPHVPHARHLVEDQLVARRKDALAAIFDVKIYPEEDHGRVGQPEVDRRVALVRQVWDHPAVFARTLAPDLDDLARHLEEDVVYTETCGAQAPQELATVDGWLARYDALFAREKIGIPKQQVEWNEAVRKYHESELPTSADAEEIACMEATSAYREMMGLRILEIDERLVRAARKHSQEMHDLHYFAHDSPVAENKSPGLRCAHEGYPGAGAENIAAGPDRGVGAFEAWYHSSGHHRNILGGHAQIGVGRFEGQWTQDFGGSSSLRGRTLTDPRLLYLLKRKKLDPKSAESEVALATWCCSQQLKDEAEQHARAALALDPENEKAHALLGEVKKDGKWVADPRAAKGAGPP